MGRLAQTLGGTDHRLLNTASAKSKEEHWCSSPTKKCWFSRANHMFVREPQLQTRCQVCLHLATMLRSVKAGKFRLAVGAASTSEISAARPMKLVVGWRFAPACCAAQSVNRRGLRRIVHLHARFGPLNQAVPVGKICASIPQKRNIQFLRRPNSAHEMLMRCRLTIRSTGPIAAGRHLGYKSLAQMPAHRNRPVTSNVSRQPIKWVDPSSQLKCRPSETPTRGGCRADNTVPARCRQHRRALALQLTPVCGWRFAPACCAAQSVRRARRCSAVLR